MSLIIREAGLYSSIQDLGRQKQQHIGIVKNGSIDQLNHRLANMLVGNEEGEALIEMTIKLPSIQFTEPTLIAFTGANFPAFVDGKKLAPYKIHLLDKGEVLKFGEASKGTRGYLAIAGGIVAEEWLGSKSTSIRLEMGGYHGRTLQAGDEIEMCRNYTPLQKKQGSKLIFKKLTIQEAERNMRKHAQFVKQIKTGIRYKLNEELNK